MAKHRCFSTEIVESDNFLDLPISSQALYFHLGMNADDRGYVNNARSIIKTTGSSVGDLEQLIGKKFVLVREGNLILIKGWRINNTIQPSRLVETKYTEDLKTLFFDENNSYTETPTDRPCQQIVDKLSTQDKLSKVKLSQDKLSKETNTTDTQRIIGKVNNSTRIVPIPPTDTDTDAHTQETEKPNEPDESYPDGDCEPWLSSPIEPHDATDPTEVDLVRLMNRKRNQFIENQRRSYEKSKF